MNSFVHLHGCVLEGGLEGKPIAAGTPVKDECTCGLHAARLANLLISENLTGEKWPGGGFTWPPPNGDYRMLSSTGVSINASLPHETDVFHVLKFKSRWHLGGSVG